MTFTLVSATKKILGKGRRGRNRLTERNFLSHVIMLEKVWGEIRRNCLFVCVYVNIRDSCVTSKEIPYRLTNGLQSEIETRFIELDKYGESFKTLCKFFQSSTTLVLLYKIKFCFFCIKLLLISLFASLGAI